MKYALLIPLYAVAMLVQPAFAADAHNHNHDTEVVGQAGAMTQGEVRKVDKAAKKITLKHGPIVNLDMPGMTMVFPVKDPAMLEKLKSGDKVIFRAEKIGEDITVTKIEPVK